MGEFDLIERFFKRPARRSPLGVGDDCALLAPRPGHALAVSSDMLVAGRHFFPDVDPVALGHKALAVNLSDLAACGAEPLGFTLALALPQADESWLSGFACGLLALADAHACDLVGGDTTRGPLNICVTVFGEVPHGAALLRSGARAGDEIWVSGSLGDARVALEALQGKRTLPAAMLARARLRLEQPTPRVALGLALRGIAHAAIDISDGLLGDLRHVLRQSGVGAELDAHALGGLMDSPLAAHDAQLEEDTQVLRCVLAGGDDYELAFTAAPAAAGSVRAAAHACGVRVSRIGRVIQGSGARVLGRDGQELPGPFDSFDHFA